MQAGEERKPASKHSSLSLCCFLQSILFVQHPPWNPEPSLIALSVLLGWSPPLQLYSLVDPSLPSLPLCLFASSARR